MCVISGQTMYIEQFVFEKFEKSRKEKEAVLMSTLCFSVVGKFEKGVPATCFYSTDSLRHLAELRGAFLK